MYTKTIVVLANSWKKSGRCVAGREVIGKQIGSWIRPVSSRPDEEISDKERCYKGGGDPSLLDIISMQLISRKPHNHQQENHVIDPSYTWVKQGRVSWDQIGAAVENPDGPLWENSQSTYNGVNDKVPEGSLKNFSRSLYLVRPKGLVLTMPMEGGVFSAAKRKLRAQFELCGHKYRLAVTDPAAHGKYSDLKDGEARIEDSLICVSLGETYKGFAYKLAAAVITKETAKGS